MALGLVALTIACKTPTSTIISSGVPPTLSSISTNPTTTSLTVGGAPQTVVVTANFSDSSTTIIQNSDVTWTTSDASMATVSAGVISPVAVGPATITATYNNMTATVTVTVFPAPASVTKITASPTSANLTSGGASKTVTITATYSDSSTTTIPPSTVTWTTSDSGVATVSAGVISPVANGTATITAAYKGASTTVAVTVAPLTLSGIATNPTTANLMVGSATQTEAVTATYSDSSTTTLQNSAITWTTSNSGVATVSTGGVISPVGAGSATITATYQSQTATVAVTVIPAFWRISTTGLTQSNTDTSTGWESVAISSTPLTVSSGSLASSATLGAGVWQVVLQLGDTPTPSGVNVQVLNGSTVLASGSGVTPGTPGLGAQYLLKISLSNVSQAVLAAGSVLSVSIQQTSGPSGLVLAYDNGYFHSYLTTP